MSDTTSTCFWSQRSTKVPATGEKIRFGIVPTKNVSATANGESVDLVHEGRQRDLVHPVAEQADDLARPTAPRRTR